MVLVSGGQSLWETGGHSDDIMCKNSTESRIRRAWRSGGRREYGQKGRQQVTGKSADMDTHTHALHAELGGRWFG